MATAHEIPGGVPLFWTGIGFREITGAQEFGNDKGIAGIVFYLVALMAFMKRALPKLNVLPACRQPSRSRWQMQVDSQPRAGSSPPREACACQGLSDRWWVIWPFSESEFLAMGLLCRFYVYSLLWCFVQVDYIQANPDHRLQRTQGNRLRSKDNAFATVYLNLLALPAHPLRRWAAVDS